MDDPKLVIEKMNELLDKLLDMNDLEKLHTYTSMRILCEDLEAYAKDMGKNYSYVAEKSAGFISSIGAIAGVEPASHDLKQYISWAYGDLGIIKDNLCSE